MHSIIDWNALGIRVEGTCCNGIDAYHMILKQQPDIVITDIRMPGLSGLDLIKKISETDLIVEFILLTGYAEFEYAKRAITYKVSNYLLKPCNENQIIDAVRTASGEIIRKKQINMLIPDNLLTDRNNSGCKDYIVKMRDYVETHLSNPNLSLKWIAENVLFMNEDYLSREFLRQTGGKFTDYLKKLRIDRAKILLRVSTGEQINSIAAQVGFGSNPQYFVQTFKNETGLTPRNYAKNHSL